MNLSKVYRELRRIRRTEEKIIDLYSSDVVKSPVHLSIGQEFVSVGVCNALKNSDTVFGTYRGHALYLAKGGDLNRMWAELYGKRDGCARGKGGSMHLSAPEVNMIGTSAVVATSVPNAVGYAYAEKLRGSDKVVALFFGDGSMDEGVFHESLNFAALKKLPVLFVCENNSYAIYSHLLDRMPDDNILERAAAYRIPGEKLTDGRTETVFNAATDAVARIRAEEGPQFIECMTYRWRDHVGPGEDGYLAYRSDEELKSWIEKDDLEAIGRNLDPSLRESIDRDVEDELNAAIAFAEAGEFPEIAEASEYVFA